MAVVNGDAAAAEALVRDLESDADPPKQACVQGTVSAYDRLVVGLLSDHAKMFAEYKHTCRGSAPLDTYAEGLRLSSHRTSNAHVHGLVGSGTDAAGFSVHASRGAAQIRGMAMVRNWAHGNGAKP